MGTNVSFTYTPTLKTTDKKVIFTYENGDPNLHPDNKRIELSNNLLNGDKTIYLYGGNKTLTVSIGNVFRISKLVGGEANYIEKIDNKIYTLEHGYYNIK